MIDTDTADTSATWLHYFQGCCQNFQLLRTKPSHDWWIHSISWFLRVKWTKGISQQSRKLWWFLKKSPQVLWSSKLGICATQLHFALRPARTLFRSLANKGGKNLQKSRREINIWYLVVCRRGVSRGTSYKYRKCDGNVVQLNSRSRSCYIKIHQ